MSVDNVYTSIACNRTPESCDWGQNGLVLFAACNSIALLDLNHNGSAKIVRTFVEHTAKVNTVKWISEKKFISGAYDKTCILWDIENVQEPKTWKLAGHEGGVTFGDAIELDGNWTFATTSLDSTVRLWHWSAQETKYVNFDTFSLGNGFCFALRFCILPGTQSKVALAYSTDENHIHLACDGADGNGERKFKHVDTLAGHADWVRGLDFIAVNENELLLASSSQDTFIRLWKISRRESGELKAPKTVEVFGASDEIQVEEKIFTVGGENNASHHFAVSLESVLLGHDGWVYSVHWGKTKDDQLQLLSASIDKTLIIWSIQDDDGVWREKVRVGEVGGNTLGFYGGKFSSGCSSILGHGYQGSFHLWHHNENTNEWTPGTIVGGHFGEVRDLSWEPQGQFLLTTSADQTTRCHAPWQQTGVPREDTVSWSLFTLFRLCFNSKVFVFLEDLA